MITAIVDGLLVAGTVFLLLFGEQIAAWIRNRISNHTQGGTK
ncbi:hypothetical protein ACWEP4_40590 [Streptomyces sp. NPDC004227]